MAQTRLSTRELGDKQVDAIDIKDGVITDAQIATTNKDGAAATPSMRTIGTGALQAAAGNDYRFYDARTPTAHTHGNITSNGLVGVTANLPLITGAGGLVQTGSWGTTANTFAQGDDYRFSDARTPTAHEHRRLNISDTRGLIRPPSFYEGTSTRWDFQSNSDTLAGGDIWHVVNTISKWSDFNLSHEQEQVVYTGGDVKHRIATSQETWGEWITFRDTSNFVAGVGLNNYVAGNDSRVLNGQIAFGWGNHATPGYLLSSSYTATDVLAKLLTVDGSGSGLDADLLDGKHGSAYQLALTNPITGTGTLNRLAKFTGSGVVGDSILSSDANGLSIISDATGFISFVNNNTQTRWMLGGGGGVVDFNLFNYTTNSINLSVKQGSGNLLINTTTDNGVDKLQVNGSILATKINNLPLTQQSNGSVAVGTQALGSNVNSVENVALGVYSLYYLTSGAQNTAIGTNAIFNLQNGDYNVGLGYQALMGLVTGGRNTAIGTQSLLNNKGSYNTALGHQSLYYQTTGNRNVALGESAGSYITGGNIALTVSSDSVFIGANTKALADNSTNETVIGYTAIGNGSNTVTLGNDNVVKTILKGNLLIGTTLDNLAKVQIKGSGDRLLSILRSDGNTAIEIDGGGSIQTNGRLQLLNADRSLVAQAMYYDGATMVFRPMPDAYQSTAFRNNSQNKTMLSMSGITGDSAFGGNVIINDKLTIGPYSADTTSQLQVIGTGRDGAVIVRGEYGTDGASLVLSGYGNTNNWKFRADHVNTLKLSNGNSGLTPITVNQTGSVNFSHEVTSPIFKGTLADTAFNRIVNPEGGSFLTQTGEVTGAIKIKLPDSVLNSNTMMTISVRVYYYTTGQSITFRLSGYNSTGGWVNVSAESYSDSNDKVYDVKFGKDSTSNCIWIGNVNDLWVYPQVNVTDVQVGFGGVGEGWTKGWNISFVTSFDTVNSTRVAAKNINSNNIGSQTVANATNVAWSGITNKPNRSNWNTTVDSISTVVGQLAWKNYGNGHTIFDASNGTSPDGSAINNGNAQQAWSGTYPTLMGWNGSTSYGVRVDSARIADSATKWGDRVPDFSGYGQGSTQWLMGSDANGIIKPWQSDSIKSFLGLGSNAYDSTGYLPLSGGVLSGNLNIKNATTSGSLKIGGSQIGSIDYELLNGITGISNSGFSIKRLDTNKTVISFDTNDNISVGNQINLGNQTSVSNSEYRGISWETGTSNNDYSIFKPAGTWTQPLHIAFYTGIKIGANVGYGGTKIYASSNMSQELVSIGDGDANVRISNNLIVNGSETVNGSINLVENLNITGNISTTNGVPFVSKISGLKSFGMHRPNGNNFIFMPSTSVDAQDWDWSKQMIYNLDTGDFGAVSFSTGGGNSTQWNQAFGWGNHDTPGYLLSSSYTATDVLTKLITVDGSGSGLDADLLDGQHGSFYAPNSALSNYLPLSGGVLTGDLNIINLRLSSSVDKCEIQSYNSLPLHINRLGNPVIVGTAITSPNATLSTHLATLGQITKAQVGLTLVDNTADNTKSVLSATKLTTARTINGVSFDGTANITLPDNNTTYTSNNGILLTGTNFAPVYGTSVNTIAEGNHTHAWSSISDSSTVDAIRISKEVLTGGGTISVSAAFEVKWSQRYILISNGNGAHFSTGGYFDISTPPLDTVITGVGGATNKTVTASGIPLGAWDVLYYILPIGSSAVSLPNNFRVANYTTALVIPTNWIKICARAEANYIEFVNGVSLRANTSIDSNLYDALGSDIFGAVASANTLATPRLINGVSFDGSANITVVDTTKLPVTGGTLSGNLTVNGSIITGANGVRNQGLIGLYDYTKIQNIWSMGAEFVVGADGLTFGNSYGMSYRYQMYGGGGGVNLGHSITLANAGIVNTQFGLGGGIWTSGNVTAAAFVGSLSGNATTASTLLTARSLWGQSFNGSANISGTLTITGGAGTRSIQVDTNNSISLDSHDNHTWLRNIFGTWTLQSGSAGDDWTSTFGLHLPAAGSVANAVWAEIGQRKSNAAEGRYTGVRIVKYAGTTKVDGDLQAGLITATGGTSTQWNTAYTHSQSAHAPSNATAAGATGDAHASTAHVGLTGANASGTWGIAISGNASTATNVSWGGVTGKPTTLSGYGITDGIKTSKTITGNIDSDYGEGFVTFDPIPTGTPPLASPNIRTINIGDNFARRTQLAFNYSNDNAYFRRKNDDGWYTWREFIHSGNIGSQTTAKSFELLSKYPYTGGEPMISDNTLAETLSPTVGSTTVAMHNAHGLFGGFATTITFSGYERYGAYQLSGEYNSNPSQLAFRNYNQTVGGWTPWVKVISSVNIGSQSVNYANTAGSASSVAWTGVTGKPTTIGGYGITDAVNSSDSRLSDARTPTAHTHDYLPLAGGNLTDRLTVKATAYNSPFLNSSANGTFAILSSNGLYGSYYGISANGDTWMQSQRNDGPATYNLLFNPLGGNVGIATKFSGVTQPTISLAIGDNDTGFHSLGDGALNFYLNGTHRYNLGDVIHSGNIGSQTVALANNLVNGGGRPATSGGQFISIDSTDSWGYIRLAKSGAAQWDLGQLNGGDFEIRPSGADANKFKFSKGGTLTLPQQLNITSNGVTTTMGALNSSWNHMDTNATNGWYFYNPISIAGGTNFTSTTVTSTNFYASNAYYLNGGTSYLNYSNGGFNSNTQITAPTFVGSLNGNALSATNSSYLSLNNTADLRLVTTSGIYRQESPDSGYSYTTTLNMHSSDGRQQMTIERGGAGMKFRGSVYGSGDIGWSNWKTVWDNESLTSVTQLGYTGALNANNYTHPENHPASIITQDASNRFVTDSEKATWNAKQPAGAYVLTGDSRLSDARTPTAHTHAYLPLSGGSLSGGVGRTAHNTGHLVGSYNSVGDNASSSNPIYTIGSSYNPPTNAITDMYGIGYSHSNFFGVSGTASGWGLYVCSAGAYSAIIAHDGAWFRQSVTATDFIGSSDATLKENIEVLKPTKINSTYKTFNFIADDTKQSRTGVIAQELEVNHPEFVRTDADGIKSVSYGDLHSHEIAFLKVENDRLSKEIEIIKELIKG